MLEFAYQRSSKRRVTNAALLCLMAALSGCMDSNSGRDSGGAAVQTYALDTTISGLNSSGLVLMVHARERAGTDFFRMVDEPSVPAQFQMVDAAAVNVTAGKTTLGLVNALPSGASYSVTIQAQPEGETCSVADATGTIQSGNAANVVVTCADQAYSVSGSIRGLNGSGLVLANGTDTLAVNVGATNFTMPSPVTYSSSYLVSIQTQPPGLTCAVGNGMGTMQASAVTNIAISCTDQPFSVGGTISGLGNKAGLTLTNGTDTLSIAAGSISFTMPTTVAFGSPYSVAVLTAPAALVCSVNNGTGTMGAADVTGVSIACMSNFSLLHSFSGGSGDAANPYHTLIQGSDGDFYGTTLAGGAGNVGTIFKITPSGTATVFYSFAGIPYSGLVQSSDGNIYGTTANGGSSGRGTVFKITPSGTESVLYSFPAGSSDPYTGLIQGSDGNFYGTTGAGGANDDGTVFKITPNGTETILHTFAKTGSDGETPYAGLIQGSDGNLYGTTYFGGAYGFGTVFKVTPGGTETVLYSFAGGSDGEHPYAAVIQGSDGNFYGTTYQGGTGGYGTVFMLTPGGSETVLYSFAGGSSDGTYPEAGLTQDSDGNFYGNTLQGGASGLGTVFKLTPSGTETVLHAFAGAGDGANPSANLVLGSDGNLYGTTGAGGAGGFGTFFKVALQK
jgi:uncharacterized repeat protein (TIGR03803 family)